MFCRGALVQMSLFIGLLYGQPPAPRPAVSGTVTEPGSNQPVVDATVTAYLIADQPSRVTIINGVRQDPILTTKTGIDGGFSFDVPRFGKVRIRADKDGFRGAAIVQPAIHETTIALDGAHPRREVKLQLGRPGEITGRVVDEETRKPLAHVKVAAYLADYRGGRRRFLPAGGLVETDADGQFSTPGLSPAEYVIVVRPHSKDDGRVMTSFTAADFDAIDEDFERTWWPVGRDEDGAVPVPVGSGQTFDLGQLAVRKTHLYRVKAFLSSAACTAGDMLSLSLVARSGFFTAAGNLVSFSCGKEVLIAGLQPGIWWIEARSDKRPIETVERTSLSFEMKDKNLEVKALLSRGPDIDVRFLTAEGARKPDWTTVKPSLAPTGRAPFMDEIPGAPDEMGRMRLVNVEPRDYQLRFSGLTEGFYVKEVRYNGAASPFASLTVNGSAMAHTIEVVIDDKSGTLTGTVKKGDAVVK